MVEARIIVRPNTRIENKKRLATFYLSDRSCKAEHNLLSKIGLFISGMWGLCSASTDVAGINHFWFDLVLLNTVPLQWVGESGNFRSGTKK